MLYFFLHRKNHFMLNVGIYTVLLCSKGSKSFIAVEEAACVTCLCIGGRTLHVLNFRSARAECGKLGSIPTASAQLQGKQTWVGWSDAGSPGAGAGQWVPLGTVSHGLRQRDSPPREYNCAFALKRPFLSSPEASLLLLLVQDLFFHVWWKPRAF